MKVMGVGQGYQLGCMNRVRRPVDEYNSIEKQAESNGFNGVMDSEIAKLQSKGNSPLAKTSKKSRKVTKI